MNPMRNHFWLPLLGLLLTLGLAAGCDEQNLAVPTPDLENPAPQVTKRIVTLAPALTQMVVDLGMGDAIVGVARNDAAAPREATIVGTYQEIDYERLVRLKPTHVLMLTDKDGVPARLEELSRTNGFELAAFEYPDGMLDVYNVLVARTITSQTASYGGDPSVASVLGVQDVGVDLLSSVQSQLHAIATITEGAKLQNVLMVIGTNPVTASGPGTVLDEVLTKFVFAANAAQFAANTAPVYDRERLLDLKPEVILLVLPGAEPLQSIQTDPRLAELRDLNIPAIRNNRVHLINHPLAALPSTSLPEVVAEMAKAVHPTLAPRIDAAMKQFTDARTE